MNECPTFLFVPPLTSLKNNKQKNTGDRVSRHMPNALV
jgi:hypothetical protein